MLFILKKILSAFRFSYLLLIPERNRYKLATEEKKIVIDGYPRSANSWLLHSFIKMQNDNILMKEIGHHVHNASQYKLAYKNNIPVLIVIRSPRDAVLSLVVRNPKLSIHQCLIYYLLFYLFLLNKKYTKVVYIVPFEKAVNCDIENSLNSIRMKFNLPIKYRVLSDYEVMEVRTNLKKVNKDQFSGNEHGLAIPTEEKEKKKKLIEDAFNKKVNRLLLMLCNKLYLRILLKY